MNKIYRIVFNQATQTWTAVAENARAKGKSGRTTVGSSKLTTLVGASAISVAALLSAQAMAEDTYFHVNTGDANQAVGDAATNEGSVDAKGGATGLYSLAAGMSAKADGQMAIAIGTGANAVNSGAIAIGEYAGTEAGVANRTIMIGSYAGEKSDTSNSILVGSHSARKRTGSGGLIAIGNGAGSYEMSTTENPGFPEGLAYTTAIGNIAAVNATGSHNDYIGTQAGYYRHGDYNVSMGYLAGAAQASYSAVDISGIRTGAMGHNNVFFGKYSGLGLNGDDNIAIGQMSNAAWKFDDKNKTGSMNDESIKVAYADDTIAIGKETTAQKNTAIAIGKGAKAATAEGDVALGAGSVTRAVTPTSSATINNVTYGTFAGAAPTSAVSVGDVGKERQIQNVAAGQINATSTDAINGSQLYAVASELGGEVSNTYFHVNTGTNRNTGNATTNLGSITDAAGATGYGAVTAGVNAQAKGSGSLALGQDSYAVDGEAVAIGLEAGTKATMAKRTVMIGSQAGNSSNTTNSVLLGWQSAYNRAGSGLVAIGTSAAGASTPLDFDNSLTSSVAIGESAAFDASGIWNSYIGTMAGSYKQGKNNVGIGYYAGAGEIGSSGKKTEAGDTGSIGSNNVAFGYFAGSGVDGNDNIAIGQWANTGAKPDGGFIGFNDTVALGRDTVANLDSNVAIGAKANAAAAKGDVALGAGSVTRAVTPTSSATVNNITYGAFAGAKPESAVSVGDVGSERQIQNVAAGQINATSTDAINGSQLYAVADKLTADIKAADTNTVTTVTAGKNITVENIGNADAPNYQVATADQVVFDSVSITNGPTINNNGINMNGNRITNVARGINGTDAVNVDQLNDATSGIYGRIDNLDKDYRAGVAGNAAMMNIPQVTRPGANLLGIGLGHHKGESAVAVGFSSSSDNEQLIFKMSGSANTQGDFTIGSGLGWQW